MNIILLLMFSLLYWIDVTFTRVQTFTKTEDNIVSFCDCSDQFYTFFNRDVVKILLSAGFNHLDRTMMSDNKSRFISVSSVVFVKVFISWNTLYIISRFFFQRGSCRLQGFGRPFGPLCHNWCTWMYGLKGV